MPIFRDPKGARKALRRRLETLQRNVAALYPELDEFERGQMPQVLSEMGMDPGILASLAAGRSTAAPQASQPSKPAGMATAQPAPASSVRQPYTPPPLRPAIHAPAAVRSSGPTALPMGDVPLM